MREFENLKQRCEQEIQADESRLEALNKEQQIFQVRIQEINLWAHKKEYVVPYLAKEELVKDQQLLIR